MCVCVCVCVPSANHVPYIGRNQMKIPGNKCLFLYFLKLICNLDGQCSNAEIGDFHPGIVGFLGSHSMSHISVVGIVRRL